MFQVKFLTIKVNKLGFTGFDKQLQKTENEINAFLRENPGYKFERIVDDSTFAGGKIGLGDFKVAIFQKAVKKD